MPLPEPSVSKWLNADPDFALAKLRGRPVLLHAFQMLCPGCVQHALPQLQRLARLDTGCAIVGLHTVFEHHAVMTVEALRAFIHEYRWSFPIGVDAPGTPGGPSRTMTRYGLRGTPSSLVLDRQGRVRLHHFGRMDDLVLGALLGRLISIPDGPEDGDETSAVHAPHVACSEATVCETAGCRTEAGAW